MRKLKREERSALGQTAVRGRSRMERPGYPCQLSQRGTWAPHGGLRIVIALQTLPLGPVGAAPEVWVL